MGHDLRKKATPYFSSNRDDEKDFYSDGYEDAKSGRPFSPPSGKMSKRETYRLGYEAGSGMNP